MQEEKNPKGTRFAVQEGKGTFRVLPGQVDTYDEASLKHIIPDPDYEDNPDHMVEVLGGHKKIVAQRGEGYLWKWEITTAWNPDKLECDYKVDGEARSLADLSQRILGDFMFERLDQ